MITLKDIAEIAGISICSALRMAERNEWESRKARINKKLINTYNITREDVRNAISQKQKKRLAAPKGSSKLPFDAGWASESGEAPTLTILKKLDDLTTPWGAHPAKSLIKPREIFPAAA